jgi:hypothetical protein
MSGQCKSIPVYRIHPGIGIARIGDSPDEFYISPEKPAALPIACDSQGNPLTTPNGLSEVPVIRFKDAQGRIKRAAARFQVYAYDDESPNGRALSLGDPIEGGGNKGVLVDILWRAYLANKKAAWYQFLALRGEHGYAPDHPKRNPDITDPNARQRLIIDPGPQVVNATTHRTAQFSRHRTDSYAATFPPQDLKPRSIDTLGELKTDSKGRLLVLGGHGHSGTFNSGFGHPRIEDYANNDGWFDDTSDGPVMARLVMYSKEVDRLRYIDVEYPAWVIAAYPRYVPEILDIITLEEVAEDVAIRNFAYRPDLYGPAGTFEDPKHIAPDDNADLAHWKAGPNEWNPAYKPWFYRDIWPILFRADEMSYLNNALGQSNFPHNQSPRGTFDPYKLGQPPFVVPQCLARRRAETVAKHHSGQLVIEALEPVLVFLDEQLKHTSMPETVGYTLAFGVSAASEGKKDLRDALRETIAKFVREAYGPTPHKDPDAYPNRWRQVYMHAECSPEGDPEKVRYDAAKMQLEEQSGEWVDKLERRAHPPEAPARKKAMLLTRRLEPDEEQPVDKASASLKDSVKRTLNEFLTGKLLANQFAKDTEACTQDPFRRNRRYLFDLLREPGEENTFRFEGRPNSRLFHLPLMPLLCGDNPLYNELPSKFLRLNDYQLFLLRQWAHGLFYNELQKGWVSEDGFNPFEPYTPWTNKTARDLDRGVLMNLMGGSFCPGAEVNWIVRNPSVYKEPYRLKADPEFYTFRQTAAQANANAVPEQEYTSYSDTDLSQDSDFETGLQPGDLTKYMALPWQSDFNECTSQPIDVTYELWNNIYPDSEHDPWMKLDGMTWETLWWPAHRPLQVFEAIGVDPGGGPVYRMVDWSKGVPGTPAGDLKMVTEWSKLGFVVRNPAVSDKPTDSPPAVKYISVERNEGSS